MFVVLHIMGYNQHLLGTTAFALLVLIRAQIKNIDMTDASGLVKAKGDGEDDQLLGDSSPEEA